MARRVLAVALVIIVALLLGAWLLSYFRTGGEQVGKRPTGGRELHWEGSRSGKDVVLDGGILKPGKLVYATEHFRRRAPKRFRVFEVFDSLLDSILGHRGAVERTNFLAVSQSRRARPQAPWQLPAPPAFRGQSTYVFLDDGDNRSGEISSSRIGKLTVTGTANAKASSEPGIYSAEAGADVQISTDIVVAVDPTLRATVLVPWGSGENDLRPYLARYLAYAGERSPRLTSEEAQAAFAKRFGAFLPSVPPPGWFLEASPQVVAAAAGAPVPVEVHVRAPASGRTLFALALRDESGPGRVLVSPLLGLEVVGGATTNDKAPTARITTPASDEEPHQGWTGQNEEGLFYLDVELAGQASDPEDGPLADGQLVWTTDRTDVQDAFLGTGSKLTARLYSRECSGITHVITLTAADSAGASTTAQRQVVITAAC
jgi:hypothetical protein